VGVTAPADVRAPAQLRRPDTGLDRPAQVALAIGAAGLLYRIVLVLFDVPATNSDEATMGLAALHISQGREFPAFFYGQGYMGTLEAYLAVPLFWLFGPSTLALRVPTLLFYAAFVLLAYQLTRRLYTPWLAVVTVALLALGADRVIKNQLVAAGGYPEISPLAVLLFVLALSRRSVLACAGFGLVAGVLFWTDWLILPYLGAAGLILLVRYWRKPQLVAVALGTAALGAAPLLVHLRSSISEFLLLNKGGHGFQPHNGVIFGVPMGTGLCSPSHCQQWQMWWGPVYPVLLVAAAALAIYAMTRTGDREERVRQLGRLALVVAAAMTLLAYARSPAAADTPVESARYLSALLISTPAVLWPLWSFRLGGVVVAGLLGTVLAATVALVAHAPTYHREVEQDRNLASTLQRLGLTRVYSEYWTCNLITFATTERVMCAVVRDDLSPGQDRYLPYRDAVYSAGRWTYVAPAGSKMDGALRGRSRLITEVPGYRVYRLNR
jgi:4-amino-4-deoxy-L-arabinose transferase-like glycosyltransferase